MFGVLMSTQPLKPTSFQPRSSATMWTMFGFFGSPARVVAGEPRSAAPAKASVHVSRIRECMVWSVRGAEGVPSVDRGGRGGAPRPERTKTGLRHGGEVRRGARGPQDAGSL